MSDQLDTPSHTEQIICPVCQLEQTATVEHTGFWNSYVHNCTGCGYTIMESEWENVKAQPDENRSDNK